MKDNLPRYTLRISGILLKKLAYVAEYEGRTKNKEIEQLIKKRIAEFEAKHGVIEIGSSTDDWYWGWIMPIKNLTIRHYLK